MDGYKEMQGNNVIDHGQLIEVLQQMKEDMSVLRLDSNESVYFEEKEIYWRFCSMLVGRTVVGLCVETID